MSDKRTLSGMLLGKHSAVLQTPQVLDAAVDVVLAYTPKAKQKNQSKRKRKTAKT